MKKRNFTLLWLALSFLAAFALWTVLVRLVDVQPIGPEGSRIGFAAMNGAFHAKSLHLIPASVQICFVICSGVLLTNFLDVLDLSR